MLKGSVTSLCHYQEVVVPLEGRTLWKEMMSQAFVLKGPPPPTGVQILPLFCFPATVS